jgi:ATP-binding cassette subfamily C protein
MRREVRFGLAALPRRRLLGLAAWSVPEALPTALFGYAIARAVDSGFLAGRPMVGLAWLGTLVLAGIAGAAGSRQVYRRLGALVEPFRDDLVRRVVRGALRHGVAGRTDDGAVARLTRQVEIVRDTFAGLIVVLRQFAVTVVGAVTGMLAVAPVLAVLILPPFVLGVAAFAATLGLAADRFRDAVRADEQVAATAGLALAATRDVVARGAEDRATALVARPVAAQASAERALGRVAALRTLCFAVGGWLPLVAVLAAAPWLARRGLTAGAIMGGLTYVLFGVQPALGTLTGGLGGSGLRYVVTLGRILDATATPLPPPRPDTDVDGCELRLRGVTFTYGPHAEPVLHDLDLTVPEGDHLVVVGASGIGKSTLAGLLCGLLRPGEGTVSLGGCPVADLPADVLADTRVLIPQEAYVFTGTVRDNLTYLNPAATDADLDTAVTAVGASALVAGHGGYTSDLDPAALSAGERQLLALARAYLSPASLVVLDEATCHLDPVAERRAEEAFAARGGTLVVIAHRLSSALRARRVLVLDGVSATVGDHETVLAASPLYRELLGAWSTAPAPEPVPEPVPEPAPVPAPAPAPAPWSTGGPVLDLAGVSAGYGDHPVLRDLDLVLADGDHVAVVGRRGAGKSTLARVAAGLLPPQRGKVLLGDVPLDAWDARDLGRYRVVVPSEPDLAPGTLRETLTRYRPGATDAEIGTAVDALGAGTLVRWLGGPGAAPDHHRLSAGARQLLGLVAAYVSGARLVILDDATGALDPATAGRVERAFAARPGALLVLCHRPASVPGAGRVLLLTGGRPLLGTHDELRARSPLYRELVDRP